MALPTSPYAGAVRLNGLLWGLLLLAGLAARIAHDDGITLRVLGLDLVLVAVGAGANLLLFIRRALAHQGRAAAAYLLNFLLLASLLLWCWWWAKQALNNFKISG